MHQLPIPNFDDIAIVEAADKLEPNLTKLLNENPDPNDAIFIVDIALPYLPKFVKDLTEILEPIVNRLKQLGPYSAQF